jgi:ankyrin repeat protein
MASGNGRASRPGQEAVVDRQDPAAEAAVQAIRAGDVTSLSALLDENPGLANARIHDRRTPLLVATDWPGYFPDGPAIVRLLIEASADPDLDSGGDQPETPLHWAASSDDADVAAALIDGGADLDRPGGSIGTPLDNAIGYGCWNVARLLVQRGARVSRLWHAAALGIMPRLDELLAASPAPSPDDVTEAFWQACHGGQRRTAERLLAHGADPSQAPGYSDQTALQVAHERGTQRDNLIIWLQERLPGLPRSVS